MKTVTVLMGGTSSEREVSLESGRNIAEALATFNDLTVHTLDLTCDSLSALPPSTEIAYIALHGGWGENGGVQRALNELKIPYTGPGARASEIAMNKIATKEILRAHSLPVANGCVLKRDFSRTEADNFCAKYSYPIVVKIPSDGSSVGVFLVNNERERDEKIAQCFELDSNEVLLEEYIKGREMTVGIIDGVALPAIEIVTASSWYGYEEKYLSNETRYPFLADSESKKDLALEKELQKIAVDVFNALKCRGVARVDFRVSDSSPVVLEINTSPGFTSHSLVPKAAERAGLSFAETCRKILSVASCD